MREKETAVQNKHASEHDKRGIKCAYVTTVFVVFFFFNRLYSIHLYIQCYVHRKYNSKVGTMCGVFVCIFGCVCTEKIENKTNHNLFNS